MAKGKAITSMILGILSILLAASGLFSFTLGMLAVMFWGL